MTPHLPSKKITGSLKVPILTGWDIYLEQEFEVVSDSFFDQKIIWCLILL
jgi:hypothetical protein